MNNRLQGKISDRSAWRGTEFVDNDAWIYHLQPSDIKELDRALERVNSANLQALEFTRDAFELPTFAATLAQILEELENGRGFVLLRGIPVERYDEASLYRLYWGIAVHLGDLISQNAKGDLIGRVEDVGVDIHANNARGYLTNAALHPHNDSSDIVGLLCVRQAMQGGQNMITSAMSIYNEICAAHPEFLDILYEGFHYDVRGEGVTGRNDEVTDNRIPLYSYYDGRLSCRFNERAIKTAAQKMGQTLSEREQAALDAVSQLTLDPQMRFDCPLQPGDLQLLNNHMVLHARNDFIDWPQVERRRLLLRLWVNRRAGEGRQLAPGFANRYNTGHRQGVAKADELAQAQ